MDYTVNGQMIILAREARGQSQQELAKQINMSATNLSKIERGDVMINEKTLEAIAEKTDFPLHFFSQPGTLIPEHLVYRRRQRVPQKMINTINAKANIIRRHVQFLTRALGAGMPELPTYTVTESQTPAKIAAKLRQKWNMDNGVTDNLVQAVEKKGIPVISFDFGTERVDSRIILTDDHYPVILMNKRLLGDRQRFSLAYELGQLVMHFDETVSAERDLAGEANAFAAAFLMPAKEIKKDFDKGLSIPHLAELKRKWKVSMIALVYRADDLGYLTPNQKRYLVQQFNTLKIRRREPMELDVPVELPTLLKKWVNQYRKKHDLGIMEMASLLYLNVDEFMEMYGG